MSGKFPNQHVADYWMQYYVKNGLCSLCGNHGVIDTRGTQSPAEVECGDVHFCICPNGQIMREMGVNKMLVFTRKNGALTVSKHHEEHPEYGELGIFAGYGENEECSHIALVSISETECQCMDCLKRFPKGPNFKSDWPHQDRG